MSVLSYNHEITRLLYLLATEKGICSQNYSHTDWLWDTSMRLSIRESSSENEQFRWYNYSELTISSFKLLLAVNEMSFEFWHRLRCFSSFVVTNFKIVTNFENPLTGPWRLETVFWFGINVWVHTWLKCFYKFWETILRNTRWRKSHLTNLYAFKYSGRYLRDSSL